MADLTHEPDRPLSHHVYPTFGREHVTDGSGPCWCRPDLYRLCTQCEVGDEECWACEGEGIIRIYVDRIWDAVLWVHHFIADDEPIHRICGCGDDPGSDLESSDQT